MLLKRKKKKSSSSRKLKFPAAAKVITSPLPLLDETSLARVYDDTSSSCSDGSSSDEDDNIWDERWVPDENEEEERRLWAAKHKQDQLSKNFNNKKAKSDDERKESRFRDLLDVSPIQRKTVTIDIKGGGKKRRSSDDGNLPRSVSDDLLTNSDEIKTSEEEDSGNSSCIDSYKPLGTGVAPVPLFFQNRSLSIDENAFVVNRHRSVSLSEEKMKSWKSEAQLRVPGKSAEILCRQPGEDRRLVASADRKKKKSRSEENLNDDLEDEEEDEGGKGLAVANNKRAVTLRKEKRNRSISVENASTAYSPIAPRRRRALTPQRTPRPFIKSPPTIRIISGGDGEGLDSLDPPSGGGTGEEECLEWKTLWKAS